MFSLSLKQHQRHSIVDLFEVSYAKGFRFGSHLGDFHFSSSACTFQFMRPLFLLFFQKFPNFRFRGQR